MLHFMIVVILYIDLLNFSLIIFFFFRNIEPLKNTNSDVSTKCDYFR